MRATQFSVALLAACSSVSQIPSGAGTRPAPIAPVVGTPGSSARESDQSKPPFSPSVRARTDAGSAAAWTLEAEGFPAVSKDGQVVALAAGELQTTGPPVLSLTVQIRSVDSGGPAHSATFRHRYAGELSQGELDALRKRLTEWVAQQNAELGAVELVPMAAGEVRDACAAGGDGIQKFVLPPLEVTLKHTRLTVRYARTRAIADENHKDWVARDKNNRFGNCEYRPFLTGVFADFPRRVLLIKADYCSPGDQCLEAVFPKFSVHRLPPIE
jgi:hypothetical protein